MANGYVVLFYVYVTVTYGCHTTLTETYFHFYISHLLIYCAVFFLFHQQSVLLIIVGFPSLPSQKISHRIGCFSSTGQSTLTSGSTKISLCLAISRTINSVIALITTFVMWATIWFIFIWPNHCLTTFSGNIVLSYLAFLNVFIHILNNYKSRPIVSLKA